MSLSEIRQRDEMVYSPGSATITTTQAGVDRHELIKIVDQLLDWAKLVVSYADLTHDVVHDPNGDWRDIAHEWHGVVEEARALLEETSGEPSLRS